MEKRLGVLLSLLLFLTYVSCIDLTVMKMRRNRKLKGSGESGSASNEELLTQEVNKIETENDRTDPDALQENTEELDEEVDTEPEDLKAEIAKISKQMEQLQEKLSALLGQQQHKNMVNIAKKHPPYNFISHGPYAYGTHPYGPYGMGFHDNLAKTKDTGGPLDGKGPNFGNGQFKYMVNDRMYPQMGMPFMGPGSMYPFY